LIKRWQVASRYALERVTDRVQRRQRMVARTDQVGTDPAVSLQRGQGPPTPLDLDRDLEASDGLLGAVVRRRDIQAGGEQPDLFCLAFQVEGSRLCRQSAQ
jgi:hypothetical protein